MTSTINNDEFLKNYVQNDNLNFYSRRTCKQAFNTSY
jgi:hypothetical protein